MIIRVTVIVLLISMSIVAQESSVAEGQQNSSKKIDDANVMPWTIKTPGEYENVYHFGYSELESDLALLFDNDKYYGQIRSGSWTNNGTLWLWKYENLSNIRVEGSKFYSDQTDGEFVIYDNGKEKKKGLKVYKPWNSYPNAGKSDVGFVISSADKFFSGKYPEASFRLLRSDELTNMSSSDLEIMQNEIYARYGYKFKEGSKMDIYFKKQKWYSGQYDDVNSFLTVIEQRNLNLIKKTKQLFCSGIYKYGTSPDGRFGILYAYPASDTTMIIYLELRVGKPSYNSGALYCVINVNKQGIAYYKKDESYLDCSIKFSFEKDFVDIVTDSNHRNCPFGNRVSADGHYKKVSSEIPKSFINRHADTIYFKTLKERYESGESIPYSY